LLGSTRPADTAPAASCRSRSNSPRGTPAATTGRSSSTSHQCMAGSRWSCRTDTRSRPRSSPAHLRLPGSRTKLGTSWPSSSPPDSTSPPGTPGRRWRLPRQQTSSTSLPGRRRPPTLRAGRRNRLGTAPQRSSMRHRSYQSRTGSARSCLRGSRSRRRTGSGLRCPVGSSCPQDIPATSRCPLDRTTLPDTSDTTPGCRRPRPSTCPLCTASARHCRPCSRSRRGRSARRCSAQGRSSRYRMAVAPSCLLGSSSLRCTA
jgi:hypothetical protein